MSPTIDKQAPNPRRRGRPKRSSRFEEARRNSSRNAMQTGLRAKTFALPHESADAAARADIWHEHCRPQNPAACHLANECARATSQADRADAYQQATLDAQQTLKQDAEAAEEDDDSPQQNAPVASAAEGAESPPAASNASETPLGNADGSAATEVASGLRNENP